MLTSACQGCSYGDAVAVHGKDGCVHTYTEGCAREGVCVHTCTLCLVCACVRMYTCCSQRGSLGIHTVEGCTREGCVLIYALLSAVVRRALGVSAYTGLLE